MKYEVNEKKFFPINDISIINSFNYDFNHIETTIDLEKYELLIELEYQDIDNKEYIKNIKYPIQIPTNITENLTANLTKVLCDIKGNEGVEVEVFLELEVMSFTDEKEEIKEEYQQELEEKLSVREVEIIESIETISTDDSEAKIMVNSDIESGVFDISKLLKTDYIKCKILTLDERNLDKISLEYNLSMEYLYEQKKQNNKVIVYDSR